MNVKHDKKASERLLEAMLMSCREDFEGGGSSIPRYREKRA